MEAKDPTRPKKPSKPKKPKFISVRALCAYLGIGHTKAYELLLGSPRQIESTTIGRRRLVVAKSARDFAKRSIDSGSVL